MRPVASLVSIPVSALGSSGLLRPPGSTLGRVAPPCASLISRGRAAWGSLRSPGDSHGTGVPLLCQVSKRSSGAGRVEGANPLYPAGGRATGRAWGESSLGEDPKERDGAGAPPGGDQQGLRTRRPPTPVSAPLEGANGAVTPSLSPGLWGSESAPGLSSLVCPWAGGLSPSLSPALRGGLADTPQGPPALGGCLREARSEPQGLSPGSPEQHHCAPAHLRSDLSPAAGR